jgi:imidazolonepropionase-like amidohydrolase
MRWKPFVLFVTLAAAVLWTLAGCTISTSDPEPEYDENQITLALINGVLIDGTGAQPVPKAVILIAGDRIAAVGTRAIINVPQGVETIDVNGAAILPGFINAHVHYGFDEENLQAWALGGVTTVRDEAIISRGDSLSGWMAFRDEKNQHAIYARLVSSGYMISVPGGYGGLFVSSPEEARQKVIEEIEAGVDAVKVSLEDGYAGTSGLPKLTPEELSAIVAAAHERGLPVSGHITQGQYLQAMLDAGVDDIAHVPYDFVSPDVLQQMADQNVYLIPTFTVYRNFNAPVSTCARIVGQFVELGGNVALGNDYGGGPGDFELGIPMYEIEMMTRAGMTPMQIIVAATQNAAHVLSMEDELGTLEAGKLADVLIVDGNPLEELQALTGIQMVIHNGVVIRDEMRR